MKTYKIIESLSLIGAFALLLIFVIFVVTTASKAISGSDIRVVDGDTIVFNGERVRLHGIDAPEQKQTCTDSDSISYECGVDAKQTLEALIWADVDNFRCEYHSKDFFGRWIGKCFVGNTDLQRALIRSGLAVAYRKYSKDYIADEQHARENKLGIWGGEFIMPWEWRRNR